jgi:predicted DNA-binding transcriptional regulator AlpA
MDHMEYMQLAGRRIDTMRAALSDLHKDLERLAYGTAGSGAVPPAQLIAEVHSRISACRDTALSALSADSHAARELTEAADRAAPPFAPWRTGLERPMGIPEIAEKLGVKRPTVDQWRQRGVMPKPTWTVGGRPLWRWADVKTWAQDTGRLSP